MPDMHAFLALFGTLILTVFGQLLLKWRMSFFSIQETDGFLHTLRWLFLHVIDPFVLASLFFAFAAALSWMYVIMRMPLSYAYPFMSLSFVLVAFGSAWLFHEQLTSEKLIGLFFIVIGVIIISGTLKST